MAFRVADLNTPVLETNVKQAKIHKDIKDLNNIISPLDPIDVKHTWNVYTMRITLKLKSAFTHSFIKYLPSA